MNRYDRTASAFVPAQRITVLQPPEPAPLAPVDVARSLQPIEGGTRDVTSAEDRAMGYVMRMAVLALVGLVLAALGVLVFMWSATRLGLQPTALERMLIFLLSLGAVLVAGAVQLNRVDFQHTSAGVERHRLDVAREMHRQQLETELELRREALEHSLRLLERTENE